MTKRKKKSAIDIPPLETLQQLKFNAAGLDIGAEEIYACVPADRDEQPVRAFPTFTVDLYALADWLAACGIDTVAMESTGVYWIPLYEILKPESSKSIWSTLVTSRTCRVGRPTFWTASGFSSCTPTVCCAPRSVRLKIYAPCARWRGIATT